MPVIDRWQLLPAGLKPPFPYTHSACLALDDYTPYNVRVVFGAADIAAASYFLQVRACGGLRAVMPGAGAGGGTCARRSGQTRRRQGGG